MDDPSGTEHGTDLLRRDRFAVNWPEHAEVKQARNAVRLAAICLDRHRLQRPLHLPCFPQHGFEFSRNQVAMQLLRQRTRPKATGIGGAILRADPACERFWLADNLSFFLDLPMRADHANRGLHPLHIQPDKQFHPVVRLLAPIREDRQLP